ncbi:MAG: Lcl C-terminal domain-containing protein [Candidatus Electronema sp. V4]|uniref:Lcl C-terminal domain-containing protein n=1 Tax=Candidatus Electronema sp. V4 TaxID=3454756 RepID=UPI0040556B7E
MKTYILTLCCLFSVATVHAACNSSIPASTPGSQLIDNGNGTITDSKTGLMWKQCIEGLSGSGCATGSAGSFTWQQALQQLGTVNAGGGFAGHADWRLPNINELRSIVEEQCYNPAINATRFPNTPSLHFWSGSPVAVNSGYAWSVDFSLGDSGYGNRNRNAVSAVRLVRGGQ